MSWLVSAMLLLGAANGIEVPRIVTVQPAVETTPVPTADDAADDPAIWVHPERPEHSLVVATDKEGFLLVYDLAGAEKFRIAAGEPNNVDLRGDLVLTGDGASNALRAYRVQPEPPALLPLTWEGAQPSIKIYGLCLGAIGESLYVFVTSKAGEFEQWRLLVRGDTASAERVRALRLNGQSEGCVCDDTHEQVFVAEENGRLLRFSALPEDQTEPAVIDAVAPAGRLTGDLEGLALYTSPHDEGLLLVSSQGGNYFAVYDRQPPFTHRGNFTVGASSAIDAVSHTDGIDATSAPLGSAFPRGLFIAQDDENPGGSQNFKFVDWREVSKALELYPAP